MSSAVPTGAFSTELCVAVAPDATFQQLIDSQPPVYGWRLLRRPAMVISSCSMRSSSARDGSSRRSRRSGHPTFTCPPSLAACRTFIFAREASAAGVIEAIRAGLTVAIDPQDRRYGDPTLIELISTMPSSKVTDAHPHWRRLSLALAWIGVCGMLLLRGRTTSRRAARPADTSRVAC